jgi:CDP-glucose 4,6-dehydratase
MRSIGDFFPRRTAQFIDFDRSKDYCLTMQFLQNQLQSALKGPVLVTGHTGFKGTWLTLLLERMGLEVVGFSLQPLDNSLYLRANRYGLIEEEFGDIRNLPQFKDFLKRYKPAAIIHLAAQPLVLESYKNPLDTFQTNVIGTANVMTAAFEEPSVKAIVAATTDKVYRNDNSGVRFVETDPLSGKDPYSASKVGSEAVISAWQNISRISGGPNLAAVRAGNVIGGGDYAKDRIMPDLIRGLSRGEGIEVRNPESTRPWQHVLDPLHGYLLTLQNLLEAGSVESLNFGPADASLSVKEVVNTSIGEWPNYNPNSVVFLNGSSQAESKSLELDSSKARSILKWSDCWTQREAIVSTNRWWQKVLFSGISAKESCHDDLEYLFNMVKK